MSGFFKAMRTPDFLELLKNPKAFALLSLIAYRAKWHDGISAHGLNHGEALIGDHASCGLTRQEYRTAKRCLERCKIITTKATTKGTVARIINSNIYDIGNADDQPSKQPPSNHRVTTEQPPSNHRATTNKEGKEGKEGKEDTTYAQRQNAVTPDENAVVTIPLTKKDFFNVTQSLIEKYSEYYPAIDVESEIRACAAWNQANPKNRKTRAGIERHINFWLSKAQNSSRRPLTDKNRVIEVGGKTISQTTANNLELVKRRQERRSNGGGQSGSD